MKANGLQICEARYFLFFPSRAAVLRRTEGILRQLPLGAQYYVAARRLSASGSPDLEERPSPSGCGG